MSEFKNNREKCISLINAGGATMEILVKELGTTKKCLASTFAQLRLMGFYPVKDEKGVYKFVSADEFNKLREARPHKEVKVRTYEEKHELLVKRETRAAAAATSATKAYEANGTYINELRKQIADLQLTLASALLGELEQTGNVEDTEAE